MYSPPIPEQLGGCRSYRNIAFSLTLSAPVVIRKGVLRAVAALAIVAGLGLPGAADAQSRSGVRADSIPTASVEREVRRSLGRARYAVIVGDMRDATKLAGGKLAPRLAEGVARKLRELHRVVVLHARDATGEVMEDIDRRRLPMLRVEGTVTSLERGQLAGAPSVRCQVALILRDEHGGALRSVLRGAATFSVQSRRDPRLQREQRLVQAALDRAVASAMSGASRVLDGAAKQAALAPYTRARLAMRR